MLKLTVFTLSAFATYSALRSRDLAHTLKATKRERDQLLKAALKRNQRAFMAHVTGLSGLR